MSEEGNTTTEEQTAAQEAPTAATPPTLRIMVGWAALPWLERFTAAVPLTRVAVALMLISTRPGIQEPLELMTST